MLKPALCAAALWPQPPSQSRPSRSNRRKAMRQRDSARSTGRQAGRPRPPAWRGYPRRPLFGRGRPAAALAPPDEGRRYGDDDGPRRWHERRSAGRDEGMMPPGMMERGAMMRPFGMAHVCGPDGGRMGEMMMERVERATQPTRSSAPASTGSRKRPARPARSCAAPAPPNGR